MNIKAIIPPGASELVVNGLHQWDYGRKLEIQADDLPALVEVHFACEGMREAVVRSCAVINGVAEAAIPDICLEQTTPVVAWVYEIGESSGVTTKTIRLPIIARARPQVGATAPSDYSDKYTELISAVNEQVEALKAGDVRVANAEHADIADSANRAGYAGIADNAGIADSAGRADYADKAGNADSANRAYYADRAGIADSAYDLLLSPFTTTDTNTDAFEIIGAGELGLYVVLLGNGTVRYCDIIAVTDVNTDIFSNYVKYEPYGGGVGGCLRPYNDAGNIRTVIKIGSVPVG